MLGHAGDRKRRFVNVLDIEGDGKIEKEAILYEKLEGGAVRCSVCLRRCRVPDEGWGFCRTRRNRGGRLYSVVYAAAAALHEAPIEMKPVYHYLPGSRALSLGTVGCNFLCPGCQNRHLSFALAEAPDTRPENGRMSQGRRRPGMRRSIKSTLGPERRWESTSPRASPLSAECFPFPPEEAVEETLRRGCRGISWTYNEPTMWLEYTIDSARLAKKRETGRGGPGRLYTNYVTNGAMTPEALDALGPHLDVFRADIKGFSRRTYERIARFPRWEGVLENVKRARRRWGMHVELVTNVIPGVNDDDAELLDLIRWIRDEAGPDTPWHVTRFFPRGPSSGARPTPVEALFRIRDLARREGLRFVYVGNVPETFPWPSGGSGADTLCPRCGRTLVERRRDSVRVLLDGSRCPGCGYALPGRFDQESG